MSKRFPVAVGGFVLVSLLAWSSFAAAAPAAKNTPVPRSTATATLTSTAKSTRTRRPTATPTATRKSTSTPTLTGTPTSTATDEGQTGAPGEAPALDVEAAGVTPVAPGLMTSKIVVFNTTSSVATVGITIVKIDGSTAYTFPTFNVAANGAVVKTLPTNLGSPFSGSAVVSSDKNVQAFVTDYNQGNSARDQYNGGDGSSSTLTLPLVRHLSAVKQNSVIAVQDTSTTAGSVTLHLYDPSGTEVGTGTVVSVKPSASAFVNTDSLFPPSGTFTGSGLLVADSGLTIAAAEQTKYYKDTASFSGLVDADGGTTLYLPFVERRRNASKAILSWSGIFVRNNGGSPTDITITLYGASGAKKTPVTRANVPANGQAQFLLNTSEFSSLTTTNAYFSGWASITSTNGQPISASVLDAQNSGARLFGYNAVPSGQLGTKYACGDTFRISSPSQTSKLNLVNLGAAPANVTVRLFKSSNGAGAGSKTYAIGPNKQVIATLSDSAFSAAGSNFEGLATVSSSSGNIVVSVNTQYSSGGITSFNCARLQ